MLSLSVEYLIKVKMVKLPGDDSKHAMMTVFRFSEKLNRKNRFNNKTERTAQAYHTVYNYKVKYLRLKAESFPFNPLTKIIWEKKPNQKLLYLRI